MSNYSSEELGFIITQLSQTKIEISKIEFTYKLILKLQDDYREKLQQEKE